MPDECVIEVSRKVSFDEDTISAIKEFKDVLMELEIKDREFNFELSIRGFHDLYNISGNQEPILT